MSRKPKSTNESRRSFLKMAAVAAPAAAATAAGTKVAEASVDAPRSKGLRKTAHVDAYLKSARF